VTYYSQAGQDEFVHSIVGDSGYFVDVGAYDGIEHSNTYALEQLGWTGLCVEPDPAVVARLEANRSCEVVGYAVSDERGAVTVQPSGALVVCCSLAQILATSPHVPEVIDYLSIDTEGHDLAVLHGMDFDRWPVRLITVEHNEYLEGPARKLVILDYLMERGFDCVALDVVAPGYGCYESWYQHRDH
jgi:hypothetical protein